MLVEDLMENNYLITPSAYYLLEPYYKRDFTLAELIKFAKAKGSFVITSSIAQEFLESKGLLVTTAGSDSVEVSEMGEGESSISTGDAGVEVPLEPSIPENASENEVFSEGESLISTGTSEDESLFEPPSELAESDGTGASADSFPVEIGEVAEDTGSENTGLQVDLESNSEINGEPEETGVEENGNGIKPKVVYGDYGVPIAYVEEEVPEVEKSYSVYEDVVITPNPEFHYRAAEMPAESEVVFDVKNVKFSPPKASNAAGKEGEFLVEAYRLYFRSRLKKMRRIFRENPEIGGIIDIGKLSYVQPGSEVTVVGLLTDKRETNKGYVLELEDATGRIKVFINKDREDAKLIMSIMHDSAVAVSGKYSGRGMIFADHIYLPDVPKVRPPKPPLKEKVYAVLLSDIHVGSNKFCEKAFEKFLEWLNGNVENETHAELVSRIKYLIIAGDAVDGVGIYPGQYEELAIPDIFDQYEALANLLRNVPKHIHIFIGPGNHDAARTALPQPGFYEEYARPIYRLKNVTVISNPAVVRLHGRDFLIAHGRGIEDVVTEIPNRSHHRPAEAMVELLRLRHLAPTFGEKVPIAPDPEDLLVIESVPDLFQAGHVHVMQYKIYNGVFVINTGTWQAQTEFQKMVNIVPTPARVPIIDVETARLRAVINFEQFCEGV